jgi:hypothetical protein
MSEVWNAAMYPPPNRTAQVYCVSCGGKRIRRGCRRGQLAAVLLPGDDPQVARPTQGALNRRSGWLSAAVA